MTNETVSSIKQRFAQVTDSIDRRDALFPTGGGDDGSNNSRLSAAEKQIAEIKLVLSHLVPKIDTISRDVAEVKGRTNAMPTTWQMIGLIIGAVGLAFAAIKFGQP